MSDSFKREAPLSLPGRSPVSREVSWSGSAATGSVSTGGDNVTTCPAVSGREVEAPVSSPGRSPASRQVSWSEVYAFAEKWAAGQGITLDPTVIAGTPQWCGMPDEDARKLLAVVVGGVRDALRNDTHQADMADASKAIAAAADWGRVSNATLRGRGANYIPRRAS